MPILESVPPDVKTEGPGFEQKMKKHHIMLVNLMGFTRLSPQMDPEEATSVQQAFNAIVNASVSLFHGNVIKNAGYAYLITFETAADVLRAGLKIESNVYRHNLKENRTVLDVKIAINTDEPVVPGHWDEVFREAPPAAGEGAQVPADKSLEPSVSPAPPAASLQEKPAPPKPEKPAERPLSSGKVHAASNGVKSHEPESKSSQQKGEKMAATLAEKSISTAAEKPSAERSKKGLRDRREIRIKVPDFIFNAYDAGAAGARYDVFKDSSRTLRTSTFLAFLVLISVLKVTERFPIFASFFQEEAIPPAKVLADFIEAEIFSNRVTGALKKQLAAVSKKMPEPAAARPQPRLTVVPVREADVPKPAQPGAAGKPAAAQVSEAPPPLLSAGKFIEGLEAERWVPSKSDGGQIKTELIPQNAGRALRIDYDLGKTRNWVEVERSLWIDKVEKEAIIFYYRATGSGNNLEVKISDDKGGKYGTVLTFNPDGAWHRVKIAFRDFSAWSGSHTPLDYASKLAFCVSTSEGGAGTLVIDQVRIAWAR